VTSLVDESAMRPPARHRARVHRDSIEPAPGRGRRLRRDLDGFVRVVPPPDATVVPPPDATVVPPPDATVSPPPDAATKPPPDAAPAGAPDAHVALDAGGNRTPDAEGQTTGLDRCVVEGGGRSCSVGGNSDATSGAAWSLLLVGAVLAANRRRRGTSG